MRRDRREGVKEDDLEDGRDGEEDGREMRRRRRWQGRLEFDLNRCQFDVNSISNRRQMPINGMFIRGCINVESRSNHRDSVHKSFNSNWFGR